MMPTEDVERRIAYTPIIGIEETLLLVAMYRIIGDIQVEYNVLRRLTIRF